MENHGKPLKTIMECHNIPWHTMVYHGMPWHAKAYHRIPWFSPHPPEKQGFNFALSFWHVLDNSPTAVHGAFPWLAVVAWVGLALGRAGDFRARL